MYSLYQGTYNYITYISTAQALQALALGIALSTVSATLALTLFSWRRKARQELLERPGDTSKVLTQCLGA